MTVYRRPRQYVMGIDPSSAKLAFAISDGGSVVLQTYKLPNNKQDAILIAFGIGAELTVKYGRSLKFIGLEAPVMGRGGPGSTIPQALISGGLQAGLGVGLAEVGVPLADVLHMINNQHWKKHVLGKGNAGKDDIAAWVSDNRPKLFARCVTSTGKVDQDLCDAVCVMLHSQALHSTQKKVRAHAPTRTESRRKARS